MKTKKVNIIIGYSKSGKIADDYKYWKKENLAGIDVKITDGKGNEIIIGSRESGSRIEINKKEIFGVGYQDEE